MSVVFDQRSTVLHETGMSLESPEHLSLVRGLSNILEYNNALIPDIDGLMNSGR